MTHELPIQVQDREVVLDYNPNVKWRYGVRPDYSGTNKTLRAESLFSHPQGSLEWIVQNLVRTFEMEATYKIDPNDWLSVDVEKFRMRTNNGPEYTVHDVIERGTYNLFLGETPHYSSKAEDFESSVTSFHHAFPAGFLWELCEVLAGPPRAVCKWRHWGTFKGDFRGHIQTGKLIEVYGITIADVNEALKITSVEHFFDNSLFLENLVAGGKCPVLGH